MRPTGSEQETQMRIYGRIVSARDEESGCIKKGQSALCEEREGKKKVKK
jgi:hypothetical protein